MPDDPAALRPADPDDLRQALAYALTFDGRKQFRTSSEMMARITAEHLARYLEMAGFVVMKRPLGARHSTSAGSHRTSGGPQTDPHHAPAARGAEAVRGGRDTAQRCPQLQRQSGDDFEADGLGGDQ